MRNLLLALLLSIILQFYPPSKNTDKTLVAWVSLNATKDLSGSVLTIQIGDRYDGIILSREEGGKWVAGSENGNRTQIAKGIAIKESDTTGELVQLAIVYKGSEILIYRNGELKSIYPAENIDLLNNDKNFVLFGMDHFGGKAKMSEVIEDARIYSQALSETELNSLEPNKPSKINPYAWWDFEGEQLIERTGKFSYHNRYGLTFEGFKLKDGKLFVNKWGHIIALRDYVPEIPEWPENPPEDWLTFHLAHPGPGMAEPGDPNPAYFYKGLYHLHYIYRQWYGFAYAHISSEDMVYWKWHPTVLSPPLTGHGMYSGTGFFTKEGQPAMIYHGVATGNMISLALNENLDSWTEPELIIARNKEGKPVENIRYWDPDCWFIGNTYYALSGGKEPELMKSDDLKNWAHLGKLLHEDYPDNLGVGRDEDISCANMFKIGKKWMLLCISHDLGCRYFLGDFKDGKFLPDFHAQMNWVNTNFKFVFTRNEHPGLVYFAPESMLSEDGRRVMWAWLMTKSTLTGIQSLPRELELPEDGILRIRPLKELEILRSDELSKENITITKAKGLILPEITGDALELKVTIKAPVPKEFGINLLSDEKGNESVTITSGSGRKTLGVGSIEPPFELKADEDLTLRIFVDKNIVEVFANDRQAAVIAHDHIRENPNISLFTKDMDLVVDEIKAWKMKSIYK
jgi:sucrose-6-phosphate hydrolase SacC (GH32 family)